MSDHLSPDPDPIRHSAPSGGGESPTPPDAAPEDPTPPDAPVGEAAGESLPEGSIPEADGGVIVTDASMGGPETVALNDLLDGEVDRGN